MRLLGMSAAEIGQLVDAVSETPRSEGSSPEERFARAAWSCLVEPGDGVAGHVVAALGAEAALRTLVAEAGDPDRSVTALRAALDAVGDGPPASELAQGVERWSGRIDGELVRRSLTQAARFGARLLVPGDDGWPASLDDLGHHAPHALWVRGDPTTLSRLERSIAMVGARASSGYGEHVAVELAGGLVDRGIAIVSGGAYGIDGAAHRAALAGRGSTVAVLAGGVDRFYPAGHEQLLSRIVEHGAVVSELPCGSAPTRWRFLQRNRNIAALSGATVVIEAGWRSGSLNTAGHAAALGRPLGAVPGPITSSASAGCHRLLRDYDAVCVTSAEEVAELLPLDSNPGPRSRPGPGSAGSSDADAGSADAGSAHAGRRTPAGDGDPRAGGGRARDSRIRVLDAMSERAGRDVAAIAALSGLEPDRVRSELGLLALEGAAREGDRGWVRARR